METIQNVQNARGKSDVLLQTVQNIQNARDESYVLIQIIQSIQIVRGRPYVLRQILSICRVQSVQNTESDHIHMQITDPGPL